jgi:hypothetical protein
VVGHIEVSEGIEIVRVGVFISLREFRKREHRQIFGLSFWTGSHYTYLSTPSILLGKRP